MIKATFKLFVLGILSSSCNAIFKNGEILKEKQMVHMINEMAMAESFAESYMFRDTLKSKDSILKIEIDKVLAINHITAEQFSESYQYYKKRPAVFKVLIDSANALALRNRELIYTKRKVNPQ